MTADVLASLSPRARRRLPSDGELLAVYPCLFKGKSAVVALSTEEIFFVTNSGWTWSSAPLTAAWAKSVGDSRCDLRIYGEHFKIEFSPIGDGESALLEINEATDAARGKGQSRALRLLPDERLVPRCLFLGGANVGVAAKTEVDLIFGPADISLHRSPAQQGGQPLARLPFAPQFSVELSGPGRFTTGGGFAGGGFGLVGAAEGMAIAGLLNALTTRTKVITVIAVLGAEYEGFFLCQEHAPDELRRYLAPVFLRARQLGQSQPATETGAPSTAAPDLVATLERLTRLHRDGALNDTEFQRAKAQALGIV